MDDEEYGFLAEEDRKELAKLNAADQQAALARLQDVNDLKEVMRTRAGRNVLWQILGWTHLYQSSLVGPNNAVFAAEGERNIGIRLVILLETHCFEEYILMKREHGAK